MRTKLACLLLIGTFYFGASQAGDCVKTKKPKNVAMITQNIEYLQNIQDSNTPRMVKVLENKAARYDLRQDRIFTKNLELYEVVFKDTASRNGTIKVHYDSTGKIVSSNERFDKITPPFEVRNAIFKEYPGWELYSSSYVATYTNGKRSHKIYKVKLRKNRIKMNLTLDTEGNYLNQLADL